MSSNANSNALLLSSLTNDTNNNSLTTLPSNLDRLSKNEILNLVKRLASERDALLNNQKGNKRPRGRKTKGTINSTTISSHHDVNTVLNVPPGNNSTSQRKPTSTSSPRRTVVPKQATATVSYIHSVPFIDIAEIKERIYKDASERIKETIHTDRNKPYTAVIAESSFAEASILALMADYIPIKTTNTMMIWLLEEEQILDWFHIRDTPYIHPVANEIATICFKWEKNPTVYAHAKMEQVEIKWERKTGTLQLKFRTWVVGFGRPPSFQPNNVIIPKRGANGKFIKKEKKENNNSD
jgi:hypothetical protein